MGLLSNRISIEDLRPGDHIYSWRAAYTYAHHGIYLGRNMVAHFTRGGSDDELSSNGAVDQFMASFSAPPVWDCSSGLCKRNRNKRGVSLSCLECFLRDGFLYRFDYGVDAPTFLMKARGGTCTIAEADASDLVLHRAFYLLENGFGNYDAFRNNCEDFAMYCKTGLLVAAEDAPGRSGQAVSLLFGLPVAAILSSPLGLAVSAGLYCLTRYAADLGVRPDVIKVPVEEVASRSGWPKPEIRTRALKKMKQDRGTLD